MAKMHGTALALVLGLLVAVNGEPLENCVDERWADDQTPPDNPLCEPYDGSKIPDCQYFLNNHTSFFHIHEHDCGKFWECSPEGPCLFLCAPCDTNSPLCNGQDKLTFDCRYQYPEGPVCDWPNKVDCSEDGCRDECCKDEDCPDGVCVDGSCVVNSCSADTDCTATECSSCVSNLCQDPTCCSNQDCQTGDCVDGECPCDECEPWQTCTDNGCTPECISDEDCSADQWCDTSEGLCKPGCRTSDNCSAKPCSECVDHQCADPECCSDDDCPTGYCAPDGTCAGECDEDSECSKPCSECVDHHCADPECCSDDDCPNGYCNEDGKCEGECDDDTDCQFLLAMECSVCENFICSNPQCCTDEDCAPGFICEDNSCVKEGECDAEHPCEGANEICDTNYSNCEYCNSEEVCTPGCADDSNCPDDQICSGHRCTKKGVNGVMKITVATATCSSCAGSGTEEEGVKVTLVGKYSTTSCTSNGLDNNELVDYDNGKTAYFDGTPDNDDDDDGLGACKNADLNLGLTSGSATWTGPGSWTAVNGSPICINFYDPDNIKPTCCCDLQKKTLATDETSDFENCHCE